MIRPCFSLIGKRRSLISLPNQSSRGFTLPVVLLVSIGLLIIGLSLTQSTSSISDSLHDQYMNRLANEAAEAGVAYANSCLNDNSFNQTWDPSTSKYLTQKTDCTGTSLSYAPNYVMSTATSRTSFSVGDLETRADGAIILSVTGKFEATTSGGTVTRTYTTTRKEVVKWKLYSASVSASGSNKTCAIVTNELYCWGLNSDKDFNGNTLTEDFTGQLGDGTSTNSKVPVKVLQETGLLAGKIVTDVVSAQYHNCALAGGKVYCWGQNGEGQVGDGTQTDRSKPVEVQGALSGKTVTAIGASGDSSCAIATGKIYCWGRNNKGTVGAGTTTSRYLSPTAVATGGANGLLSTYTATALSSSGSRSFNMCAIADSKAYCWGNNEAGQVGNGTSGATNATYPTAVRANSGDALYNKTVTSISQDGYWSGNGYPHVCAVAAGAVYCWGENQYGQLGNNSTTDSNVPVAVSTSGVLSGKTIDDVVVGLSHSCVVATSKAYCWGYNGNGQLGDGTNTQRTTPVAVKANVSTDALYNKTVTAIGGGSNRGCAIADLKTYCWGRNDKAQLGDGTTVDKNYPVRSIFLDPKAPTYVF